MRKTWACSAVGSAPHSHCGGREFESLQVHQKRSAPGRVCFIFAWLGRFEPSHATVRWTVAHRRLDGDGSIVFRISSSPPVFNPVNVMFTGFSSVPAAICKVAFVWRSPWKGIMGSLSFSALSACQQYTRRNNQQISIASNTIKLCNMLYC